MFAVTLTIFVYPSSTTTISGKRQIQQQLQQQRMMKPYQETVNIIEGAKNKKRHQPPVHLARILRS